MRKRLAWGNRLFLRTGGWGRVAARLGCNIVQTVLRHNRCKIRMCLTVLSEFVHKILHGRRAFAIFGNELSRDGAECLEIPLSETPLTNEIDGERAADQEKEHHQRGDGLAQSLIVSL